MGQVENGLLSRIGPLKITDQRQTQEAKYTATVRQKGSVSPSSGENSQETWAFADMGVLCRTLSLGSEFRLKKMQPQQSGWCSMTVKNYVCEGLWGEAPPRRPQPASGLRRAALRAPGWPAAPPPQGAELRAAEGVARLQPPTPAPPRLGQTSERPASPALWSPTVPLAPASPSPALLRHRIASLAFGACPSSAGALLTGVIIQVWFT